LFLRGTPRRLRSRKIRVWLAPADLPHCKEPEEMRIVARNLSNSVNSKFTVLKNSAIWGYLRG
jgi:hypothetical protein